MTWLELARMYDTKIKRKIVKDILWSDTGYPSFYDSLKDLVKQFISGVRANKNKINRCDLCLFKRPFHQKGCYNSIERAKDE